MAAVHHWPCHRPQRRLVTPLAHLWNIPASYCVNQVLPMLDQQLTGTADGCSGADAPTLLLAPVLLDILLQTLSLYHFPFLSASVGSQ